MKTKTFLTSLGLVLALSCAALTTRLHRTADASNDEANIAEATARLLQNSHYAAHHFDGDLSARFLDRYLEALDPGRQLFLESDVEEFAPYRTSLEQTTARTGDTGPEHQIFERFQQRLEDRAACVHELLKTESFDFTGSDTYRWDRQKATRPRDLAEAKQLWRQQLRYEYLQEKLANKKPEEIVKTLSRRYERGLHALKQLSKDELLEIYLTALTHAYDPHSDYMGRRQMEDFGIAMNLSLVGIGATLQAEDGYCKIRELVPGGPAAHSKLLKPGDRIVAVAQEGKEPVDVIDMPLAEAVTLIRGAKGTKVHLTFIPADTADSSVRKTITLVRDEVHLEDQAAKARIVDLEGEKGHLLRLGIIDLPSFYSGSENAPGEGHKRASADTAKIIRKLKEEHVQGIILDLRRNGGGSLEEAIALTGLFIKRGPVVQTKDTDGDVKVEYDPDPSELYDGPLVVLTSRFSASASEILAGALQDYGRAIIVGDTSTFGKGTVQSLLPLERVMRRARLGTEGDPGALKLTIREFYRPGGASTQLKGVESDIVVPSATEVLKVGEAEMADALGWDAVAPARHADFHLVAPFLSTLQEKSAKRITTDQELAWLKEDMERARTRLADPVVSLNEKQRRQEKAELDAQAEARKKERAARPPSSQKEYEITLKNADAAGLPEPLSAGKHSSSLAAINSPEEVETQDSANSDKAATPDATLEETKRILADYISLLRDRPDPVLADSSQ
jgi:carboxyl-terminal processing protease